MADSSGSVFGNVTRALLEVDAHDGAAEGSAADLWGRP